MIDITTHVFSEQVLNLKSDQFDAMVRMCVMDAGAKRAEAWLRESGLYNKCRIGVVGMFNDDHMRLDAVAKVVLVGTGQSFMHRELYIQFPSDHFKAKVLLVTGGP